MNKYFDYRSSHRRKNEQKRVAENEPEEEAKSINQSKKGKRKKKKEAVNEKQKAKERRKKKQIYVAMRNLLKVEARLDGSGGGEKVREKCRGQPQAITIGKRCACAVDPSDLRSADRRRKRITCHV